MEQKETGTPKLVEDRIRSWERGRIFFIDDFASVESQGTVRLTLMRLAQEGIILRLARGIYYWPKIEGEYSMSAVIPSPEVIAHAYAAKERVRIIPYGDQAAHLLGLTGLKVSDLKYLTDGSPRRISLSNGRKIWFCHTSEVKIFDFCNNTMQLVSSAIRALTDEFIDGEKKRIIQWHLSHVPEKEFEKDIKIPPTWVQKIMLDIWNS